MSDCEIISNLQKLIPPRVPGAKSEPAIKEHPDADASDSTKRAVSARAIATPTRNLVVKVEKPLESQVGNGASPAQEPSEESAPGSVTSLTEKPSEEAAPGSVTSLTEKPSAEAEEGHTSEDEKSLEKARGQKRALSVASDVAAKRPKRKELTRQDQPHAVKLYGQYCNPLQSVLLC